MTQWAIVAIPQKDDYVWSISSERVPHMTILYLGEQEMGPKAAKIETYLTHAVETMLKRFGMSVDRRGTLGPNDADVVFFDMNWCERELNEFRSSLLKDPDILEMYNSTLVQYPVWVPHLTLGFPESPAKPDERDYPGLHYINFDKIALWVDDFDGPEIELKSRDYSSLDVVHMAKVSDFLTTKGILDPSGLVHSDGPTLQDVYNSMSPEQKELADLIAGAAVEDVILPEDMGFGDVYDSMTDDQRNFIHFIVGAALSPDFDLEHSGVKGMKWGVRKADDYGSSRLSKSAEGQSKEARAAARAKVRAGSGTLGDAHLAGIKSTGHRVTNAILGDKTYWKRAAIIAGVSAAGIGASFAAPAVLPASTLAGIAHLAGAHIVAGHVVTSSGAIISASTLGGQIATQVGLAATFAGNNVANLVNGVSTTARAIRGNKRVDNSYAKLGAAAAQSQASGTRRTQKVLNRAGSVRKNNLRQSDLIDGIALWVDDFDGPEIELKSRDYSSLDVVHMAKVSDFLTTKGILDPSGLVHSDGPTLQDVYNSMSPEQKELADLIAGAAVEDVILPEDMGFGDVYDSMTDDQRNFIHFIVGAALSPDFDLEHSGVKGMKWGVRKADDYGSSRLSKSAEGQSKEARAAARAKVRAGSGTLGDAHLAGIKSTGHRVTNAILGDKTYWKRAAIIAGVSAAGIGASFAAPAVLPASTLAGIAHLAGAHIVAGHVVTSSGAIISASTLGGQIATQVGLAATFAGNNVANLVNGVSTTARAIRGNKRVDNSYAKLGAAAAQSQASGTRRTQKVLNRAGSVRKNNLRQSDLIDGISLDQKVKDIDALQFGRKGMKWGVRRVRGSDGRVVEGRTSTGVSDARQRVAKAGGIHGISNDELRQLTERINLENNYNQSIVNRKTQLDVAHSKVKRTLDLGKTANQAINFGGSNAGQLLLRQIQPSLAQKALKASQLSKAINDVTGGKKKGKKNK